MMQYRTVEEMEQLLARLLIDKDRIAQQVDECKDSIDDISIRMNLLGTVVRSNADLKKEYQERIEQQRTQVIRLENEIAERSDRIAEIRKQLHRARQTQSNRIACS